MFAKMGKKEFSVWIKKTFSFVWKKHGNWEKLTTKCYGDTLLCCIECFTEFCCSRTSLNDDKHPGQTNKVINEEKINQNSCNLFSITIIIKLIILHNLWVKISEITNMVHISDDYVTNILHV